MPRNRHLERKTPHCIVSSLSNEKQNYSLLLGNDQNQSHPISILSTHSENSRWLQQNSTVKIFFKACNLIGLFFRGSWRPIGHMRPSSPLLDSVRDLFEGQDQLARDFTKAFQYPKNGREPMPNLFDIAFIVGQGKVKTKLYGVRAILGVRSRYDYILEKKDQNTNVGCTLACVVCNGVS